MKNYDFKKLELEISKRWRKINLLKLLREKNKRGKPYFLLEGPPYANNVLHVGHLRNIFYKDLNQRYQFMLGKDVLFTAGFDTHGLPIESMVEKKLHFKSKKDILKFGVNNFTKECKKLADLNVGNQMQIYDLYGCWMAWDKEPYLTYNNSYLESAWWSFKRMWKKGQVYQGLRPVHWCPHCETSLAGAEIEQVEKTDPGVYVKFKLENEDAYLLVFTTTPWTLPSNVVIAAAPKGDYVKVKTNEGNLILAKAGLALLDRAGLQYKITEKFKGKKLEGKKYLPLLAVPAQKSINSSKKARRVVMSIPILKERVPPKAAEKLGKKAGDIFEDFVSTEEGTGLVHVAPGHGRTDNEVGKHYNLPEISPLDDSCCFTGQAGKYSGKFVKDADTEIIEDLKKSGSLLYSEKVRHKYPICWRCKNGLIFRLSKQWFFKTDPIRKKLLSENNKVNWMPGFAKENMDKWLANYTDWNFTRQRFWGIPVPLWINDKNEDEIVVIESKQDLEKYLGRKLPKSYDLHNVVELTFPSKTGKGTMRKIPDIFDVWYDSGVATWAWMGAPFKNKKLFEKYFPVDRISEGIDQIRGWFTSLMYTSVSVFGKTPYLEVSMPAFAVDARGEKMSKSVGNVVWADEGIKNLGADLIRFYYMSNVAPYDLAKFNIEEVKKETFGIINTLWNLHSYLKTEFPSVKREKISALEDKWIISRLNSVIQNYHKNFENFEYHLIGRDLADFIVRNLSRTYVQLVRERAENKDNAVGYVLLRCISEILKLLAPISPFVSDQIYLNLDDKYGLKEKSVHLERLPKADVSKIDKKTERDFELIRNVISDILMLREKIKRNLRWPIKEFTLVSPSASIRSVINRNSEVLQRLTNSLGIKTKADLKGLKYEVKLNFKEVGKKYRKHTNNIAKAISKLDPKKILNELKEGVKIKFGGKTLILGENELDVRRDLPKNLTGLSGKDYFVYLDAEETPEMLASGYSREIIRRVQDARKKLGMKKSEKIKLELVNKSGIKLNMQSIKARTNAVKASEVGAVSLKNKESFKIRGKAFETGLSKS